MFSRYLLILIFIGLPVFLQAQKENNIWYFGDSTGLDFNSGQPVQISGSMFTTEGCATICDANGSLLFYTNGINVWNRNHTMMPDGKAIGGDYDDAQSALIIALPGAKDIYYIFTNDRYHIAYSIVDMKADGGNGDIITKDVTIMRNNTEGLAAALHCNGTDYWIVGQSLGSNSFYAFAFNSKGLNSTPVISSAGISALTPSGFIKFSSQSDKMAVTKDLYREVFRFDRKTGKLGELIVSLYGDFVNFSPNYGFQFSPDGSKLYFCGWGPKLYQFDLSAGDSTAVKQSRYDIPTGLPYEWGIAIGPDNRIYITGSDLHYLDIINNPDVKGSGCNFQASALYMKGRNTGFGLPAFPAGGNSLKLKPKYNLYTDCGTFLTHFNITDSSNVDSIKWQIVSNSGNYSYHSKRMRDSVKLPEQGKYRLTLYVFSSCTNDTFIKDLMVWPVLENKTTEYSFCPGESISIGSDLTGIDSYTWNEGSHDSSMAVSKPGTYQLRLKRGNCEATQTFNVKNYPSIWTALGHEYYICNDDHELVKLDAGKGFEHYLWYPTGDSTQWIMVDRLGDYYVIVKDFRGCSGGDSTIVKRKCPGYLYFPNVFTPNNDSHNDLYLPEGTDVLSYHLRIYNRWGEEIFETQDLSEGWNGKFKGFKAPEGTYIWMSEYSLLNEKKLENHYYKNGTLQLIR